MKTFFCACFLSLATVAQAVDDFLDRLDEALTISAFHDQLRARVSGLLDLEYYHFPQPPPGLINSRDHDLFNPRLSLFLDAQIGPHVYFFLQSRLDTGFDPTDRTEQLRPNVSGRRADLRADEYALRVTPWSDGRVSLQVGWFATVVGTWVERHLSWENPFVNAPLPYEEVSRVPDLDTALTSREFRSPREVDKYEYLPIIWGPVYSNGVSLAGRLGMFEYAAEMKSAAVASRPESWDDVHLSRPAFDLRLGFRPNEAWRFGLSGAEGNYLRSEASATLPSGHDIDDYRQFVLGQDISYARGHLQVWAEAFEARYQVPRLGNLDTFAYYLEAKYKITPQLFAALRWNQQIFGTVRDDFGGRVSAEPDVWRIDAALGYRFTAHTQLKLQYILQRGNFFANNLGSTFAAQFTVRF
jgi:hypothetical protein